ncbi:MAG: DUF3846 domain-containing protein [Mogibacterium sp.]|nr:DUF3846 domain-containing protein [Mogibacterium sp.]
MRVLIVEPNREPKVAEIENTLEAKQSIVGGFIEMACPPSHSDDAVIICNEEGKFNGSVPNRPVFLENGSPYDIIFSTFFICRAPFDSDDFEGLTDEQIDRYSKFYA